MKQSKSDTAKGGSPDATKLDTQDEVTISGPSAMPKVGHRVLEHLQLQQLLERHDDWALFLADDDVRAELVLVAVGESQAALTRALAGPSEANVVSKSRLGSLYVAEILLDESHVQRFGGRLLPPAETAPPRASVPVASEGLFVEGSLFANRYRIDGLLGHGGMGEVYRAYDQTLLRPVALKIVRVSKSAGNDAHRNEAKRRLVNEARLVSLVQHPHIVEVYDAGESEGFPFLVLELCEGGNLRKAMADNASQADRMRWLEEIAEALAHAHDQGIIHRDIKPENVLLTGARSAKVADFGIAKLLRAEPAAKETVGLVGTPRYMAPEQLFDNAADIRADQFAWGLVGYELLAGLHPRSNDMATLKAARSGARSSKVPWRVRRALVRATSSDPAARYPNFHALLADLRPKRRSRIWPVYAGAAGVVAVAGAILGNSLVTHRAKAAASETDHSSETSVVFDAEKIDKDIVSRCAPAAQPSLAAGLQLWRDASQWDSLPKFEEAAKLDPECAQASLYYLLATLHTYPRRREQFRHAREQRNRLNERERLLLDAIEPTVGEPPNYEETVRLTAAMSERLPMDQDLRRIRVRALARLNRLDEALSVADQTAALFPEPVAGNEFEAALVQTRRRETSAAYERFARCLHVSPDSGDCLIMQGAIQASEGQCVQAASTFQHLTEVMPTSERAHFYLANVLLTSSNNADVARSAFEERWRHRDSTSSSDASAAAAQLADEYRMAVLSGDLERALVFVRKWNEEVGSTTNGWFRGQALLELIGILQELGYDEEARSVARRGLREHRAWTTDERLDLRIELARAAYVTGGIDATRYRQLRDEWQQHTTRKPQDIWVSGFAGLPVVDADMAAPIGPGEYVQDWISMTPETFARASTELLHLGRISDALLHGDAAARECLAVTPASYLHAQLVAAQAHDAAHDIPTACKRYAILRRLLAKSSRSVTLRMVMKRIKELPCAEESLP